MNDLIYLDNNATTPILPEVADAMRQCQLAQHANPASQHRAGRRSRQVLEDAREGIALLLGADLSGRDADRIVFTSGGTEANNLALRGMIGSTPGHLIISAIEHPSLTATANQIESRGSRVHRLGVDGNGVVQIEPLDRLLDTSERLENRLISVMMVNHETGVVQPVTTLAKVCSKHGFRSHTDAVQAVGKDVVNFRELGVDAMSCSAHKFHGPVGIGALVIKGGIELQPVMTGGFQQAGLRPGTEPVALVVGMYEALRIWKEEHSEREARITVLRDRLEASLRQGWPQLVIHGSAAQRLPHTVNIAFPGLDQQTFIMALDLAGIACSTGSACASGSSEPSPVLEAMGCDPAIVRGSLRLSLGTFNTVLEVDLAASHILNVAKELQRQKRSRKMAQPSPSVGVKPL